MTLSAYIPGALLLLPSITWALPPPLPPSHYGNSANLLPRVMTPTEQTFRHTPAAHATLPRVAGTWFAGWHAGDFPPENVSWKKYTTVTYAFAETKLDPASLTMSSEDDPIVRRVVQLGHEAGTRILISIGGWTGSRYFSTAMGNEANRTQFINAITTLVNTYNLDGVDFDWEYPGNQGIGCNIVNANDSANFLELLKEIRASPHLAQGLTLTAATAIRPFIGIDGNSMGDVSEFAKYLDYIQVMNYDIWGPWSKTAGPNAPLNDTCATEPSRKLGSTVSAVASWTTAGFPVDQIVLGVASYGHSYSVNHAEAFSGGKEAVGRALRSSYPAFNAANQPSGDLWDDQPGVDVCGVLQKPGGTFNFWGLITSGFLNENGTAKAGISYLYDNCSQTPSVYNSISDIWVSYDNAESFAAKGAYIKAIGLRGFSMWEAGGDYDDILLDSVRKGAGFISSV